MKNKIIKIFMGLSLTFSSILPANLLTTFGAENFVIVDDTQTDATQKNYFSYSTASDPNGVTGWASDTKTSIQDSSYPTQAQSQHWVWNSSSKEAAKHTYTFTFEGTGVELIGVKSDSESLYTLDDNAPEVLTNKGEANKTTTLYSKKNLSDRVHTVKVTLPATGGNGLQISYAKVFSTKDTPAQKLDETTIPFTKTTGTNNKFTYSPTGWNAMGQSDEHVWSNAPADKNIWYEVSFIGSKIDIYAGKNRPMGNVKYSVDGKDYGVFSLYNNGNINATKITTIEGLSEGSHILRAEATGTKEDAASNTGIDCANVVVYHTPYTITDLILNEHETTISDGATYQIQAAASPDYAQLKGLTYTSSNDSIVSVDKNGLAQANKVGSATITVTAENFATPKTVKITVIEATKQLKGSIVDTNTQYTQNKYNDIKTMGTISKTLTAWQNDKATSQIALLSVDSKINNVSITAGDFKNGDTLLAKNNITTTFIKSTKAYNGNYLGYGDKTRPVPTPTDKNRSESSDILYQTTPIDISYNTVQPIWVEVNVPKGTTPGSYTGDIIVTADGLDKPLTFTYTIVVQKAELQDASIYEKNFDIELWQYPYSSAEYYGVTPFSKQHLAILEPIMEKYKSIGGHAITTSIIEDAWGGQTYSKNDIHYPSMVKWNKQSDGTFTYDYTDFDKWVQFNKDLGIGDKIVIYSIAPWGNAFTYWDNGKLVNEKYSVGNKRYTEVWTDFLNNLVAHLDEKGWFHDSYMGIDERGFSKAAFDIIDTVKNKDGLSLKTAGAMDGFVDKHDLAMRVTDLNVGDTAAAAHPSEFANLLQARQNLNLRTTLYSCTEHKPGNFSLSAPSESYWSIINAGKKGTAGFLRWAYDAWVADPIRDATHNAFEPGDTFLIFPDEKDAENPIVHSSVRLERMAEGVRDVNKIMQMTADFPSLQNDVDAMYAKINTEAATSRSYLSNEKRVILANEMDTFKADLAALTEKYSNLKEHGTTDVTSVSIQEGDKTTIEIGTEKLLHAKVLPENVINASVQWSSDNSKIVQVTKDGMIRGVKEGTVNIHAISNADKTKKASIQVQVTKAQIDTNAQVSYYNFDKIENNTIVDSWGKHNGTGNEIESTSGIEGNALYLKNPTSKVDIAAPANIGETWSISMWLYSETVGNNRASLLWNGVADPKSVSIDAANGPHNTANANNIGVHVDNHNNGVLSINQQVPLKKWTNLAVTNSRSDGLRFYIDGKAIGNANGWTKTNAMLAPNKVIGGLGFIGKLDELKIYNKVLSPSEVSTAMAVKGLNIQSKNMEIKVGNTAAIETNLISDGIDKTITYTSDDPSIATVDANGIISAKQYGDTYVTVKGGGFEDKVFVRVTKDLNIQYTIPQYNLPEKNITTFAQSDTQYYGQPDMVLLDNNKTMIGVYPEGHGVGNVLMKRSEDAGKTWTQDTKTPKSWKTSQETPTIYKLDFKDGSQKLIMITGCPGVWGDYSTGWQTSISSDGGDTWSEYQRFHEGEATTVAMASLIQLKDDKGNFIDKWMGVYHNSNSFVNYKTYLTFDGNGKEQWSQPEPYLSEYRNIEKHYQICEVGMFRSPDGKRIVALARSQSHQNKSTMFYSDDEGQTWSKPRDMQGALQGERHKIAYDPISGRLLVTFREITLDYNKNGSIEPNDWMAGDWIAWVGTYDDLMQGNEGQYRIRLKQDFTNNAKGGDCGYAGISVLPDGTFTMLSYGHFDKEKAEANTTGNARNDPAYIVQAQFKLSEIDNIAGLIQRDKLKEALQSANTIKEQGNYTKTTWNSFISAKTYAVKILNDDASSQNEIDNAAKQLQTAQSDLTKEFKVNVKASNDAYGSVQGGGTILEKQDVCVRAAAKKGYHFVNWTNNEKEVSKDAKYTFKVKENITLVANFEKNKTDTTTETAILHDSDSNITLSGVFDKDTQANINTLHAKDITRLKELIKDKQYISKIQFEQVYDIKLTLNDKNIQPNGDITINIPLQAELLNKKLQVLHIDEQGNVSPLSFVMKDSILSFKTSHLSYFAIVSYNKSQEPSLNAQQTATPPAKKDPSTTKSAGTAASIPTGDTSNMKAFIFIACLSLGACFIIFKQKSKHI